MGNRRYTPEEKGEAVKLAEEIGGKEAAVQLQIPEDTLYTWLAKARKGTLQTESKPTSEQAVDEKNARFQEEIVSLKKELQSLKSLNEQIQKENKLQEDVIDFFINRQKK